MFASFANVSKAEHLAGRAVVAQNSQRFENSAQQRPEIFRHLLHYIYGGTIENKDLKGIAKEIIDDTKMTGVVSLKLLRGLLHQMDHDHNRQLGGQLAVCKLQEPCPPKGDSNGLCIKKQCGGA